MSANNCPSCLVGIVWNEKAKGANPDRKPRQKTRLGLHWADSCNKALFWQLLQPTCCQMYRLTVPLDHNRKAKRGALLPGKCKASIKFGQASCALETKLQLHRLVETQHGRLAVTGYKSFLIGVEYGRQGLPPMVGEMFGLTEQLPPALSWAAPSE